MAQDCAASHPQSSGPGLFNKACQPQLKVDMALQANYTDTVIMGARASLIKPAEAEVYCVGGWFTGLFPGQNSFHFTPVKTAVGNKCHSGYNPCVCIFCALQDFDKNQSADIKAYS